MSPRWAPAIALGLLVGNAAAAAGQPPFHIHSDGYGPVRVGMTLAQASRALGVALVPADDSDPREECAHVQPASGHAGLTFMLQGGRITRASLYPGQSPVVTPRGVGLGDPESKVLRLYGPRLKAEPSVYGGPQDRYLTYWVGKDRGVRFEIEGGRVTSIFGGDRTIELVEGCS